MIFITSLKSIFGIIFIILLGYILREKRWFHDSFSENISKLITNVALPSSIFISVLKYLTPEILVSLSNRLIYTFLSFIIGYVVSVIMVKLFKIRQGRRGIFINGIVNANTIFIGLPLNISLFGEESLPYYLMYYITNTVSIWTLGAFLVALIFLSFEISVPDFIESTFSYIGNIVTPLSLMYIGIVLADAGLSSIRFDRDTVLVLVGRFIFSPIIMVLMIWMSGFISGNFTDMDKKTFMVQSAVPIFAVLPILVNEAGGDVKYATNIVATSTMFFVIVIPIIMTCLKWI